MSFVVPEQPRSNMRRIVCRSHAIARLRHIQLCRHSAIHQTSCVYMARLRQGAAAYHARQIRSRDLQGRPENHPYLVEGP